MEIRPAAAAEAVVSVLVPVAVAAPYTYRAPGSARPGDIVAVPLGSRTVVGVIWDDPPDPEIGDNRLRAIEGTFDAPPLSPEIRGFVDWVADYTLTGRGMVLRMVLRSPGALEPPSPVAGVRRTAVEPPRMTPARQRVLSALEGGLAWSRAGLAAAAGVSPGVITGLVDSAALEVVMMPAEPPQPAPQPDYAVPILSEDQAAAAQALRAA